MADPESLRIGDIIEVNVLDVPSYGVELEYEGKPGFMQIPELSWDTAGIEAAPEYRYKSIVSPGDKIRVKIIGLTEEKFYASLRQLNPEQDPWAEITEEDIGRAFSARIQSVAEYGHFVRLDNGLDGLLLLENALRTHEKGAEIRVQITRLRRNRRAVEVIEVK